MVIIFRFLYIVDKCYKQGLPVIYINTPSLLACASEAHDGYRCCLIGIDAGDIDFPRTRLPHS